MSRSLKNRKLKHGAHFHWVSYSSNKLDKQYANRSMRRNNRIRIKLGKEPYHHLREVCDNWNFNSDGGCSYVNFLGSRFGHKGEPYSKEDIRLINRK